MIVMNENYLKLQASYLFSDIAQRLNAFQEQNPDRDIIRLGIGDVTRALPAACIAALHAAVDEMANDATFRGYGPELGYGFLRQKVAEHDFQARGLDLRADEVLVRIGALAAEVMAEAIVRAARAATSIPGYPAAQDLHQDLPAAQNQGNP